jgi:hypothetical protein
MRDIDFGDAFLLSMVHWCGIGKRSTPLESWQVFLVRAKSQIVGISGAYQQPGMPHMSAGSVGLEFVLNFAVMASAAQQFTKFAVSCAALALRSFGFTPVRLICRPDLSLVSLRRTYSTQLKESLRMVQLPRSSLPAFYPSTHPGRSASRNVEQNSKPHVAIAFERQPHSRYLISLVKAIRVRVRDSQSLVYAA